LRVCCRAHRACVRDVYICDGRECVWGSAGWLPSKEETRKEKKKQVKHAEKNKHFTRSRKCLCLMQKFVALFPFFFFFPSPFTGVEEDGG
jgi:hypothetical protein